jgi:predicted DNA-binding transcriptional regulator AlpA
MSSTIENLPPEFGRHRVLTLRQTCDFTGLAYATVRAMHARGKMPPAIRIGTRKLGWRLGDLIDWIQSRVESGEAV